MSSDVQDLPPTTRRPAWRQRLVDAETGLRVGFRADSTLFAFGFCAAMIIVTAMVFGLTTLEWAVLTLSLGLALAAELFHQVLKQMAAGRNDRISAEIQLALRLGTAAVMAVHLTAVIVAAILLSQHFAQVWKN